MLVSYHLGQGSILEHYHDAGIARDDTRITLRDIDRRIACVDPRKHDMCSHQLEQHRILVQCLNHFAVLRIHSRIALRDKDVRC